MAKTLISLGANLGNTRQVMQLAGAMILDGFGNSNVQFSRLYRTPAVGGPSGQDDFYNAVATIESTHTAFEVWRKLNSIEHILGRQRRSRWEARRIDLDVLLHDDERHWTPTLKIPHPRMIMRTFVLEPAREIAADWIEPVTGQRLANLAQSLQQLRAAELQGKNAIHIMVLSESAERSCRIAKVLFEGSNPYAMNEPSAISQRTMSQSEGPVCIRLDAGRRVSFWSLPPLAHPASHAQIKELRVKLDEQIFEYTFGEPLQLLVFAGASPDPTLIHWEDYCRSWAMTLGLIASPELAMQVSKFRRLPKYLLAAEDPTWAAHELLAAMTAMTCPVQPSGAFFDE